ncbi:hypothetical protein XELAEV_18014547mg [Xenopus laevis]|uniref:Uncharacterized protein n=1 Tax=Xenopus laevis TaxID=8355 RepID=A0A974DGZ5_XENLA|nr:hypothetical protein XELAEV_18014547mg [Xenopus laevis]
MPVRSASLWVFSKPLAAVYRSCLVKPEPGSRTSGMLEDLVPLNRNDCRPSSIHIPTSHSNHCLVARANRKAQSIFKNHSSLLHTVKYISEALSTFSHGLHFAYAYNNNKKPRIPSWYILEQKNNKTHMTTVCTNKWKYLREGGA